MLKYLKIKILSWLLFQANSETKAKEFYAIKNDLLSRFGQPVGRDLQRISGKICFHCDGTGECNAHYWCDWCEEDWCHSCSGDGWYKLPQNNVLVKIRFGKYVFHQPTERLKDEEVEKYVFDAKISGYIKHKPKKYGEFALKVLYWIYNREALKQFEGILF